MGISKYRCLWLIIIVLIGIASTSLKAEDSIHLNHDVISLTDRKITGQLVMTMDLANPALFDVTVNAPAYGGGKDTNYFYLKPRHGGADQRVKVHIDFPYEKQTPGGPYTLETINTVEANKKKTASNQYNQCPGSHQKHNGGRVCKPFSFVVIDNGAIPGLLYQTQLNVVVRSGKGKPVKKTITLTYKNTMSAIGIYSPNDRFHLNTDNHFTAENSFCVYSRGWSRRFDVRLEGQGEGDGFLLRGRGRETISYNARVRGNLTGYSPAEPGVWSFAGLSRRVFKNFRECGADRNLWVTLNIPENQVMRSSAGRYTGTLTVRVRAK